MPQADFCSTRPQRCNAVLRCNSDAENRNAPVASLMTAMGAFFSSAPKIHKQGCAAPLLLAFMHRGEGAFIRPRGRRARPSPFPRGPSLYSPCPADRGVSPLLCFGAACVRPPRIPTAGVRSFCQRTPFHRPPQGTARSSPDISHAEPENGLNHTHPPSPAGSPPQCAGRP